MPKMLYELDEVAEKAAWLYENDDVRNVLASGDVLIAQRTIEPYLAPCGLPTGWRAAETRAGDAKMPRLSQIAAMACTHPCAWR